jgi:hypothetical protein
MANETVDAGAKALDMADKYISAISGVIADKGPQAYEFALVMGRLGAAQWLVTSLIWAIVFGAYLYFGNRAYRKLAAMPGKWEDGPIDCPTCWGKIVLVLGAVVSVPGLVLNLYSLTNIYAWIGLFHPQIWIARQAMKAAGL